jgi:ABC-type bacteriocin/lantibiotic exporter with double-glycine peptidase domain
MVMDNRTPIHRPDSIQRVIQEDDLGCGLACVAMVTGMTYWQVRTLAIELELYDPETSTGLNHQNMKELLDAYALTSSSMYRLENWHQLPAISIIGIKSTAPHWVVAIRTRDDAYLIDPSPQIAHEYRRDFGRMRLLGDGLRIGRKHQGGMLYNLHVPANSFRQPCFGFPF